MMKFKHLFDNRDLTFMLLKNWDYNIKNQILLQICNVDLQICTISCIPYNKYYYFQKADKEGGIKHRMKTDEDGRGGNQVVLTILV